MDDRKSARTHPVRMVSESPTAWHISLRSRTIYRIVITGTIYPLFESRRVGPGRAIHITALLQFGRYPRLYSMIRPRGKNRLYSIWAAVGARDARRKWKSYPGRNCSSPDQADREVPNGAALSGLWHCRLVIRQPRYDANRYKRGRVEIGRSSSDLSSRPSRVQKLRARDEFQRGSVRSFYEREGGGGEVKTRISGTRSERGCKWLVGQEENSLQRRAGG